MLDVVFELAFRYIARLWCLVKIHFLNDKYLYIMGGGGLLGTLLQLLAGTVPPSRRRAECP